MFRVLRTVGGSLLILAVVLGAGCSGGSSEKDAKADAERRMGEALSKAGAGQTKVDLGSKGSVDLSGLPEILRFPGATALAHTANGGPGGGDMYVLQSDQEPTQVAEHYKQQLASWKQVHAMEGNGTTALVYLSPDESQQASVIVATDPKGGKTLIRVTIGKR
jgi:hypothetical protein